MVSNNQTFQKFYGLINNKKGLINKGELKKILKDIQIDPDKLNNAEISKRVESKLSKDVELAKKLGLRGTPAFVIGDNIIFGYLKKDELLDLLN